MVKQKDKVEYEFHEEELIAALNEALEFVKEKKRAKKTVRELPVETVLPAKKHRVENRLRTAAL